MTALPGSVQVHGGNLHDGRRFAMKIQYPGVARSIESDVDNLMRLIKVANLLPKGLYIEQAAEVSPFWSSLASISKQCSHMGYITNMQLCKYT